MYIVVTDNFLKVILHLWGTSQVARICLPMRETVPSPGSGRSPGGRNGNPLEYSCLKIPRTEEPGGLQSTESQRVGHD